LCVLIISNKFIPYIAGTGPVAGTQGRVGTVKLSFARRNAAIVETSSEVPQKVRTSAWAIRMKTLCSFSAWMVEGTVRPPPVSVACAHSILARVAVFLGSTSRQN